MSNPVIRYAVALSFLAALVPGKGFCDVENLDELMGRKSRQASAEWSYQYVEDIGSNYHWQPETLCYKDVQTGNEVWRISNTPAAKNIYHNDIGVTPWSADGKRMAFRADRETGAFGRDGRDLWMVVNTDGSHLRPIINGPARVNAHNPYFHWSPQLPDVYYGFGRTYAGNKGVSRNVLYKATVFDNDVSMVPLLTFPTTVSSELFLNKTISGDGRKVIAMPWNESWWYPATIYPDDNAALDDADGYSVDRNMDSSWGDTPSSYSRLHDQYYAGNGESIFVLPSGTHAWWRLKVLGSAVDGGSQYSFNPPNVFEEQWPENTADWWGGTNDPFHSDYWSHFVPDRWGTHALFSSVEKNPSGPGVYDIKNHQWVVATFGGGAQHHDWHGFTDWTISSGGSTGGYLNHSIKTQRYNDSQSQRDLCYTHTLYNNNGVYGGAGNEYSALARPAQSPDGTKAAFHSTFLNAKLGSAEDNPDIFWVVAYYPYPPSIIGVSKVGGNVRLTWQSPKYTDRGWPDEVDDPSPEPKEIKYYHVWISTNNIDWTELTTVDIPFGTNSYDIAQPNSSIRYYALTSEEHSRLESRALSNIWMVTLDNSGALVSSNEVSSYPTNPGEIVPFWTNAPPSPSGFSVSPTGTAGHQQLTWTEPGDPKIRYYNIYYSNTASPPPAIQQTRIASVPVGTSKWLDWNADPASPAHSYVIRSVDRQGNESGIPGPPDATSPGIPTDITPQP